MLTKAMGLISEVWDIPHLIYSASHLCIDRAEALLRCTLPSDYSAWIQALS